MCHGCFRTDETVFARYLLRQGMAVRGHHEEECNLTQFFFLLRSNEAPQLRFDSGRSTVPLKLNANRFERFFVLIGNAQYYSINFIADEATDIGHKKQLVVYMR